jgi:hypothetical protein
MRHISVRGPFIKNLTNFLLTGARFYRKEGICYRSSLYVHRSGEKGKEGPVSSGNGLKHSITHVAAKCPGASAARSGGDACLRNLAPEVNLLLFFKDGWYVCEGNLSVKRNVLTFVRARRFLKFLFEL